jgi:hypothetical protein
MVSCYGEGDNAEQNNPIIPNLNIAMWHIASVTIKKIERLKRLPSF